KPFASSNHFTVPVIRIPYSWNCDDVEYGCTEPIHHRCVWRKPFPPLRGPTKTEPGCAQFRHWRLRNRANISTGPPPRKGRLGRPPDPAPRERLAAAGGARYT